MRPSIPSMPDTPSNAPVVLTVGKAVVCCDPQPGYPGCFVGHPDTWEPSEPDELGPVYFLARSASKTRPDRWLQLSGEIPEHIQETIWAAFERERAEADAAYADELLQERELYGW